MEEEQEQEEEEELLLQEQQQEEEAQAATPFRKTWALRGDRPTVVATVSGPSRSRHPCGGEGGGTTSTMEGAEGFSGFSLSFSLAFALPLPLPLPRSLSLTLPRALSFTHRVLLGR